MQAVILAAGRGKRLHPITYQRSKAMLPVLGKPIVQRILEAIASAGVSDFVLVINPADHELKHFFQERIQIGMEVRFTEQSEPRGMAHALSCAEPLIRGDFLLSACDSLLPQADYASLLSAWQAPPPPAALLALLLVQPEEVSQSATVQMEGVRITRIIEKSAIALSNLISLPVYLFDRRIFSYLARVPLSPRGELELQDAIQSLIDHQELVRGVLVSNRLNLTSASDLLALNLRFLQAEYPQRVSATAQVDRRVTLCPPYWIGDNTVIGEGCRLGPNVYLESDCRIGKGCVVANAVLLRGASLEDLQTLNHQIVFPGLKSVP